MARDVLTNSFTRPWLIDGRARPDHTPEYFASLKMGTITKNFGGVNQIYDPDEGQYNQFVEAGEYRDAEERPATSLMGHYAANLKSRMLELGMKGCAFDVQLHIGQCEDPRNFNDFQKIIIWEKVILESYDTEDMGALQPDEQNKIDETGTISARRMYEFVPLAFSARTPSVVTNELLDVIVCDSRQCGECGDQSDGCQKIMAISKAAGGSPSTPADVIFSLNGGKAWYAVDIDTLDVAQDPTGIACVGNYVVVVANGVGEEMHIALISEFDGVTDPEFSQVTTGFVAGGAPLDIHSLGNMAYICGEGGYIYKTDDPASGVEVIDAGSATITQLNAIHMLSEDFGVAVGNDGVIITINSDLASALATSPVAIGTDINTVHVKSETEWYIGDSAGVFQYTLDGGQTWTVITLPGQTSITAIEDIDMSSDSVMYVAATRSGKGEVYISVNGGQNFIRAPRNQANAMPNNDQINAIAVCEYDVDFVVGVGLAADGSDGFIVVGSD